jgi:serine/threonine-protein kinase HipA
MTGHLSVWWDDRVAGSLHLDQHGDMEFTYAPEWLTDGKAPALSFSLPKRVEAYGRRECQAFFGGILPEEGQRHAIARALGVSAENEFRLLEHLGGEVAGALMLLPDGSIPQPPSDGAPDILSDDRILALLDRLPVRPMLAGEGGLRLSLAGAQSKLPVLLIDGQIALPAPGQPTSHILKPPIARFEGTTENEYFCMTLAAAIGLDVAPVEMRTVAGRPFLLITRYDRTQNANGPLIRLHQEDFAQALGISSQRKYASEGGPTFKDSFALLRRAVSRPARDILKLLDAAIFNLIIGNADAHSKNFSLLHTGGGLALAPLYDLLSTVIYPDLSAKLAMKIARQATLEEIQPRHWDAFADDIDLTAPYIHRRVKQLCDATLGQIDTPDGELHKRLPDGGNFSPFADLIHERALKLAAKA